MLQMVDLPLGMKPETVMVINACRSSGAIMCAHLGSTLLVLLWLVYTIEVTLQENTEDADGVPNPGRISELIRVYIEPLAESSGLLPKKTKHPPCCVCTSAVHNLPLRFCVVRHLPGGACDCTCKPCITDMMQSVNSCS